MVNDLKKTFFALVLIISTVFLSGCSVFESEVKSVSKQIGVDLPKPAEMEFSNTHGGFHGDGETFAKFKFDEEDAKTVEEEISQNESWKELPMSENLSIILFGGEKDGINYGHFLDGEYEIPQVKNGYWFFNDRHSESTDSSSDAELLNRGSYNFTAAIYDSDNSVLYFYKLDT